jgi:hypothetical protein
MKNGEKKLSTAEIIALRDKVEARLNEPGVRESFSAQQMIQKSKRDAAKAERAQEEVDDTKVDEVLDLFGRLFGERLPLFIPQAKGTKKPTVVWGKLTQLNRDESYWKSLKIACTMGGNIAVKLGKDSDNLVAIDFDNDELMAEFIAANEKLTSETLCTKGAHGCQFWFWAVGRYPKKIQRICVNGNSSGTGECRGGRGLSTLWGIHPSGKAYERINDVAPIEFAFKDIIWPNGWSLVEVHQDETIDWEKFNDMLKSGDGDILEALVSEYFEGAVDKGTEWRCANITGEVPTNAGSFTISKDGGWCHEFDGEDWSEGILDTITSEERAEKSGLPQITVRDVFKFLKESTGENFLPKTRNRFYALTFPAGNRTG